MLYLVVSLSCMALIVLANVLFNQNYSWYVYVLAVAGAAMAAVIVDGLTAWIIRSLPEKLFRYETRLRRITGRKLRLFKALKVKKWKEKVPELGMFTNFRKNKLADPRSPGYVARYILEACYGIVIHYASVPASFLILLPAALIMRDGLNICLCVALPAAVVNAILIVLPAFVLESNLPALVRVYERLVNKEQENRDE